MSDSGTDAAMDEEGNRILKIHLPSGKTVGATVDPSLRINDLVISIATNNKLNPTAFQIAQPSKYKGRPPNVYTPSQSAGDIEGNTIMLIPKREKEQYSINKGKKSGTFEHTVRLTIYSSKNHKMTFRTNPAKRLDEVFEPICEERGVDPSHYMMRVHKQKVDADMTQPISSFGTLEFDLLENDVDNKKKSGLFGRLKKKKTEKSNPPATPTVNGSHVKPDTPPEKTLQKQNSTEGTVKKRPAPPPPTAGASTHTQPHAPPPPDTATQAPSSQLNRVTTKKRRAPPVPVAVATISAGQDEADIAHTDERSDGYPPSSPAASQHSSLGTSDRDTSISGSIGEQDMPGPQPPSKPPRQSFYSDHDTNPPIFIPPSPPHTPPSASLPPENIERLIAEGRLNILEDVDEVDRGTTAASPGSDVMHSTARENNLQSGDEGSVLSSSHDDDSKAPGGHEGGVDLELESPLQAPVVLGPPPYVEQMPPPPMPPSPASGETQAGEGAGGAAQTDNGRPKRVCKCMDPENGEDCDCDTPGAIRKPCMENGASNLGEEQQVTNDVPLPLVEGPPDVSLSEAVRDGNGPITTEERKPDGLASLTLSLSIANIEKEPPLESPPISNAEEENDPQSPFDDLSKLSPKPKLPPKPKQLLVQAKVDNPSESEPQITTGDSEQDSVLNNLDLDPKHTPRNTLQHSEPEEFIIQPEVASHSESAPPVSPEGTDSPLMSTLDSGPRPLQEPLISPTYVGQDPGKKTFLEADPLRKANLDRLSVFSFDTEDEETAISPVIPHKEEEGKPVQLVTASTLPVEETVIQQKVKISKEEAVSAEENKTDQVDKALDQSTPPMKEGPKDQVPLDLKDMYIQMQKQMMDLQQTMLAQQQSTNQMSPQNQLANQGMPQQPFTNQVSPQQQPATNQAALLQLQQLQQQMMLQQQLLMQQGLIPQSPMMMPPVMMQPSPIMQAPQMVPNPQMMVQMTPQMAPMMQPYMVAPQQQMVMMSPPTSQPVPTSTDTTQMQSPAPAPTEEKVEATGFPEHSALESTKEDVQASTQHPVKTVSSAAVQKEDSKTVDKTPDKTSDDAPVKSQQSVKSNLESQSASPSSRRKDVFADILKKKKNKPSTNYVLSAQREMLNRERSNSVPKVEPLPSSSDKKVHFDSASPMQRAKSIEHSKSSNHSLRDTGSDPIGQMPKPEASAQDNSHEKAIPEEHGVSVDTERTVHSSQTAITSDASTRTSDTSTSNLSTRDSLDKMNSESPSSVGQILPSESLKGANVVGSSLRVESKQSPPQSEKTKDAAKDDKTLATIEGSLTNNNNVVLKENGGPKSTMNVTPLEARFAGEGSSDAAQMGSSTGDAAKPPPPTVPPRPRQGPRPFSKSKRPVSLVSDTQSELQQMAGLSNVSRFKEMMEGLKSKENSD